MEHVKKVEQDELADGARRSRNQVTYDDGMSEEQWLQVRCDARSRRVELTLAHPTRRRWKRTTMDRNARALVDPRSPCWIV